MDFANPWAFSCRLASEYKNGKRKMLAKRSLCKHFLSLFALCRGLWLGPAGLAFERLCLFCCLRALTRFRVHRGRFCRSAALFRSRGAPFAALRRGTVVAVGTHKALRPVADEILASRLLERLDDELFLVRAEPLQQRALQFLAVALSRRRRASCRAGRCPCSTCRSRACRAWGRSPAPARAYAPWSAGIPQAAPRPQACSRGGTT